ncbi:MAG: hypothetical protein GTO14_13965 [Anaerolineales bacterium]|nr:hypothetical protein [Anaerolineales bacterium]
MAACAVCGTTLMEGQAILVRGKQKKDPPIALCPNCAADAEREMLAESMEVNVPGAVLGGFLAAALSAIVWYAVVVLTNYQLGILAIAVGWLVGQGVMFGAGRKRGPILQVTSVVITLIAMAVSEYLIVRHVVNQILLEEGLILTDLPIFLPIGDALTLIMESVKSDPLTLLFWGIALFEAFIIPGKRQLRKVSA